MGEKNNPEILPLFQKSLRCNWLQAGPGVGAYTCCQALSEAGCWGDKLLVWSSRAALMFYSFVLFLSKQNTVFTSDVKHNALSSHILIFFKIRVSEYNICYQVSTKLVNVTQFTHNILLLICNTKLMSATVIWHMNTAGFNKHF